MNKKQAKRNIDQILLQQAKAQKEIGKIDYVSEIMSENAMPSTLYKKYLSLLDQKKVYQNTVENLKKKIHITINEIRL